MMRLMRSLVAVVGVAASSVVACALTTDLSGYAGRPDAGTTSDAGLDAGPRGDAGFDSGVEAGRCDLTATFDAPELVTAINATGENDRAAHLTPDELTVYFSSDRTSARRVYRATRASTDVPFSPPAMLTELAVAGTEYLAAVPSADDLLLVFASRVTGGNTQLRTATRSSPSELFADGADIPSVSSAMHEDDPYLSPDGLELWFARVDPTNAIKEVLWTARRGSRSEAFAAPVAVAEVDTAASETDPTLSDDGLELFFGSNREGPMRVWRATRSSKAQPFGAAAHVSELDGVTDQDIPSWLSPDRCVLYFTSYRDGRVNGGIVGVFVAQLRRVIVIR
jgi:Tol biopolymer transport system component